MLTEPIANVLGAVRQLLLDDSAVYRLVPDQVYCLELPEPVVEARKGAAPNAIVCSYAGGKHSSLGGSSYVPVLSIRIDVLHYGKTRLKADQLYRHTYPVFKAVTRHLQTVKGDDGDNESLVLIHSCLHDSGPNFFRTRPGDWPVVAGSWIVIANQRTG